MHSIRYYGWYSNKARGLRKKAAAAAEASAESSGHESAPVAARSRCSKTWAMLIKRVYEVDPLTCPRCGSEMAVVAFLEPPQREVTCLPVGRSRRFCVTAACGPSRGPHRRATLGEARWRRTVRSCLRATHRQVTPATSFRIASQLRPPSRAR